MSKTRIAFIGAGNMAASLIGGLRAKGLDASQIRASDPGAETRAKVAAEHGIGKLKRRWLPMQASPAQLRVMHAIKREFDPLGLLSQGNVL